jgi:polar amino acid transport system substrate-binding protein
MNRASLKNQPRNEAAMRKIPAATLVASALALVTVFSSSPSRALTLLTEENPPLNYTENGKLTGMATEVVGEMAKRAGITANTEVMEWKAAYKRAQSDRDTCLYATARLENREWIFTWVGPIAVSRWALFAKEGFTRHIGSLADARPFRIGGVTYDAKTEYLKQNGVTNIFEVADDKLNPGKLTLDRKELGRIDLWITNASRARLVAAQAGVKDIKPVYTVREDESYLACSPRTAAETIKALTSALASIKKDGTYKKIVDRYERK